MDRQLLAWIGCGLLVAAAGCAQNDDDKTASAGTPPAAGSGGEGTGAAHTHRPVIEEPATSGADSAFVPATTGQPALTEAPPQPAGEAPRSAFVPEGESFVPPSDAIEPPESAPSAAGSRFNPLRVGAEPTESPNPLRSFAPTPRMSIPRDAAPQFAPEATTEPSPSVASAEPPAAVPDPSFHSLSVDPSAGVSAGGPAAPETSALVTSPSPRAPEPAQPFEVVQVFYGTDRAAIDPAAGGWMALAMRFLPAGCALVVTLCLLLIAASKRSVALWVVATAGVLVCVGLGYQAANSTLVALRWEGKQGPQYTIDRAPEGQVQLGVCEVTIPRSHEAGELESPSILRLEVRENAAQHVRLSKTEPLADDAFFELLRERVQASPRKELFIFVHGFDTQFEDAARRTAQIHYDLKFQGAPIFFSWPANNKSILTYPADENTIGWTAPHLKQFLLQIVKHSDAESINLIAHSMGSRAMSIALREIELEFRGQSRLFNHVVLAAPDIDADEFKRHIAPAMQQTANHVTLYASSRDDALRVSQLLHRGARAGDSGRGLVVLPGMDTIDVTAIDTSPWGHIYLGSSDPVLQDLKHLFLYGFPPQERRWLSPAQREGLTYWIFEGNQTAARATTAPR